jgi:predicted 2-oxoglutarate/Fe(II)-dependent dioxygenase YbiX
MMLWDKPRADIAYCLVSTPTDLIGWENKSLHQVDHINRELRVTIVPYERDSTLEDKIKVKVEAARVYYDQVIQEISKQHTY